MRGYHIFLSEEELNRMKDYLMLRMSDEKLKFTLIGDRYIVEFESWETFVDFLIDILKVFEKYSDKIKVIKK